jgi:hypothetical protein
MNNPEKILTMLQDSISQIKQTAALLSLRKPSVGDDLSHIYQQINKIEDQCLNAKALIEDFRDVKITVKK